MSKKLLAHLYFLGKTFKKVKIYRNSKDTLRNIRFIKNMSEGMTFFLDFLKNPFDYCVNNNAIIYYCENDKDIIYQIVHNIDSKRYIEIIINFGKDIIEYLVSYYKTIMEGKKYMNIIKLEYMKKIFIDKKVFFDKKLYDIQESIDGYQGAIDDVMKKLP